MRFQYLAEIYSHWDDPNGPKLAVNKLCASTGFQCSKTLLRA